MIAKMRVVEYHAKGPDGHFLTTSYKEATTDGNKILEVRLVPANDETYFEYKARQEYREKVWAKFHKKPRA